MNTAQASSRDLSAESSFEEIIEHYRRGNLTPEEAMGRLQQCGYWVRLLMNLIAYPPIFVEASYHEVTQAERDALGTP